MNGCITAPPSVCCCQHRPGDLQKKAVWTQCEVKHSVSFSDLMYRSATSCSHKLHSPGWRCVCDMVVRQTGGWLYTHRVLTAIVYASSACVVDPLRMCHSTMHEAHTMGMASMASMSSMSYPSPRPKGTVVRRVQDWFGIAQNKTQPTNTRTTQMSNLGISSHSAAGGGVCFPIERPDLHNWQGKCGGDWQKHMGPNKQTFSACLPPWRPGLLEDGVLHPPLSLWWVWAELSATHFFPPQGGEGGGHFPPATRRIVGEVVI